MLRLAAVLVGTYFLAFGVTSYVSSADSRSGHDAAVPEQTVPDASPRARKGDSLGAVRRAERLEMVTQIELVGVSNTSVTLRDREGRILFRSDPVTNTTLVARDADLPVVTVKRVPAGPARVLPLTRSEDAAEETSPGEKPIGCESSLSVLADPTASRRPSRCLAAVPPADLRRHAELRLADGA